MSTASDYALAITKSNKNNGIVIGQIFLGPTCPVMRIPPDPACAPKPYRSHISITIAGTGRLYKTIPTTNAGIFKLSMVPGTYLLEVNKVASGSPYPRCTKVKFVIASKKTIKLIVNCDTGIR